jgi:hypothetical protein
MVADPCHLIVLLIVGAVVHEAHLEEKAARFASEQLSGIPRASLAMLHAHGQAEKRLSYFFLE